MLEKRLRMNDIKIPVQVDPNEDTEWNDILRSQGIIPEKPPSPTEQLESALEDALRKHHESRLESKNLEELAELEDDEDEEFLNMYQQRRIDQLKQLLDAKKFGLVFPISKDEYQEKVTAASENYFVLVHLSLQSSLQSRLLASHFEVASRVFAELKFCDIPASRCIENYPERNCPTLILYHKGAVLRQYVTLAELGGNSMKLSDLERVLVRYAMVNETDERLLVNEDDDDDLKESYQNRFQKKSLKSSVGADNDDYDDFYD